ncbi:toprim domain-containing protein [Cyclobacterium marinum]|uniref:Putative transposon-related/mobilization protein n=1 Tax=Cyclobacterium marinum (strain ATCC 25205 / DSM 745 / LMG 13164 / NCIMB 1802) TaxID=880070 RepID=G0J7M3_CYCMS|nr:toprim domain-containing protein [Cyclobacterium marinum]AEL26976.1 putative transposon-related/mobilization protein [Cyclobacterium marinum DSM 745]
MNAKEANKISIITYLDQLGIRPSKVKAGYCFYYSPYREESTPSFKVSPSKNLWVDFGDGNAGGTLIDLVLKMNPSYTVPDAIREIASVCGSSFFLHQPAIPRPESSEETATGIKIIKTKPLGSNRAISDYLQSRRILLDTAKEFCCEVYYRIGDNRYFGLGNPHENGWAIRNKYWKGCTAQGVSTYCNNSADLCLFEGIFDLLSYREMRKGDHYREDFMVLNSLANLQGFYSKINKYSRVNLFLDRDKAGKEAARKLMDSLPHCRDQSELFHPHKDLNEYWMSRENLGVKR